MQSLRNDHHPAMRGLTALQDGVCDALFYALKKDRDWAMSRIKDNRPGLKDRLVELVKKADSEAVQSLLTDVDTWAKWLKNARNAIGHLIPRPGGKAWPESVDGLCGVRGVDMRKVPSELE
jgi:hypothetical protein